MDTFYICILQNPEVCIIISFKSGVTQVLRYCQVYMGSV